MWKKKRIMLLVSCMLLFTFLMACKAENGETGQEGGLNNGKIGTEKFADRQKSEIGDSDKVESGSGNARNQMNSEEEVKIKKIEETSAKEAKSKHTEEASVKEAKSKQTKEVSVKEAKSKHTKETSAKEAKSKQTKEASGKGDKTKETKEIADNGNKTKQTKEASGQGDKTKETKEAAAYSDKTNKTQEDKVMNVANVKDKTNFYGIEFTEDSEIFARIKGKSYKDNCTVPVCDLRYLHVLHIGFDGETHEGEIVCHKLIAEDLLEIFEELYNAKYPIEKIKLVDEYNADDEASMAANNSSSFNFRFISYTKKISKHGYGLAMDINTLYNPYVKTVNGQLSIEPANAAEYVDRSKDFPHKIDENDLAYKLFVSHGFEWGGAWKNSKDYQHFEVPDSVVKKLSY